MTRIAYLTSLYPAPSHTFIRREIAALRDRGLDILPFSITPAGGPLASDLDREMRAETEAVLGRSPLAYVGAAAQAVVSQPGRAWRTFRLAMRHRAPGRRARTWALFHLVEAFLLARLLRNAGATRLHSHFANSGATVGMLAAHFNDIPWSLTLHGVSETDYPAGLLLGEKVARADFVSCASYYMRAQAMRATAPDHWDKLHIVRCGVDLAALPRRFHGSNRFPHFVCVGRLSDEKGHCGLFDAFARVLKSVPDARLSLVGDGPLKDRLVLLAEELGIARSVTFHGMLDETTTLATVATADALVLASFMEGLPVVLMEAMALGRPVIASGVAGVPELVRDGVSGLLFPPSDWDSLAQAMLQLAGDADLRARLGAAGRLAVEAEFAVDKAVVPLVALFTDTPQPVDAVPCLEAA